MVRVWCVVISLLFLVPSAFAGSDLSINDFNSLWSGAVEKNIADPEGNFSRLQTAPAEGPSYFATTLQSPVSLENRFIRVKIRINAIQSWGGIEMRLSSDAGGGFNNFLTIPIQFYSDPEFNIVQDGEWADLTLTLGEAKSTGNPDYTKISQIGFYVASNQNANTPFVVDFKDFKIESSVLPAIVSMTFDDGYSDHFRAAEIMAQYNLRGTAYIMTREVDDDGYVTSDQLQTMANEMGWSISSHHKTPITEFTPAVLLEEIEQTYDFLGALGFTNSIGHFAYPLGKQSRRTTLPIIREFFKTARVAGGGAETLPPSDWHMLRTYNVTPDKSPEEVAQRIEKAIEHNEWLILMFHYFSEGEPENDLTYNYEKFDELCEKISKLPVKVHPVNEVYEALDVQ